MTIPLLLAVVAGAVASFQVGDTTHSEAQANPPPKESVVFYYQNIDAIDVTKFRGAYAVVTAGQGNAEGEREAASLIESTGAKSMRYVNFYWYPQNSVYQSLNISNHKGWIFCGKDKRKIVGRKVGDQKWFFLDANERAARNAIIDYLKEIKGYGYDGVFFDRGASSFLGAADGGNYISWKTSTCTKNKVIEGSKRTFSDVFASLLKDARNKVFDGSGQKIFVNFGKAPYTKPKLRPDPSDKHCRARDWARCSSLRDVWKWVDQVIDEAPSHAGSKQFLQDYKENLTSERNFPNVLGEIKVAVKDDAKFKKKVYYQWAQARLFRINLFVNTGDDQCKTSSGDMTCWRYGTAPDLTKVRLGAPIDELPRKMACQSGSETKCLWVRRYRHGMVAVNVSKRSKTLNQPLGVGGRLVTDVYSNLPIGTLCVDEIVDRRIPPRRGRVYQYAGSDVCP